MDIYIGTKILYLLKFFANAYETVFSMPDPPLHDPVAVLAVSHPHLLKFIECNVSIELSGTHTRGATVVDVHGEHREDQGEDVDQQGRRQHIAVHEALRENSAPEPVPLPGCAHLWRATVKTEVGAGRQHHAGIAVS